MVCLSISRLCILCLRYTRHGAGPWGCWDEPTRKDTVSAFPKLTFPCERDQKVIYVGNYPVAIYTHLTHLGCTMLRESLRVGPELASGVPAIFFASRLPSNHALLFCDQQNPILFGSAEYPARKLHVYTSRAARGVCDEVAVGDGTGRPGTGWVSRSRDGRRLFTHCSSFHLLPDRRGPRRDVGVGVPC